MNYLGIMELETPRLRLRCFCPEDAGNYLENWAGCEQVFRYISQSPMSRAGLERCIL